ncbi:phospho-N-acetylmuramoyl-pentapeptide-transferase [Tichowtungia aerotolerans]|uniref:Phospho-N-acetylmuramoyl-pentapeptide-transferase n=1 Tax=Tichowtungia aerotolerans TaxID=2697043 RepID=A0A6P1M285_9BACT|nr:phospho-N-acetylmuramoyl-pentapeptide-transferase [Tichowtungia aerotolerans]QHI67961.1 phospho-N-acetylmuramoyl-pentapeptide-transferase [Tichowtungia aerotolerans]
MLYWLSEWNEYFSPLRMFRYITFRSVMAAGTAFTMSLIFGPWVIEKLRQIDFSEQKEDHRIEDLDRSAKVGTPTMGGMLILFTTAAATVMWSEPGNFYVMCALTTFGFLGNLGLIDDYLKLRRGDGLSPRIKLAGQCFWTGLLLFALLVNPETAVRTKELMVPFVKAPVIPSMGIIGTYIFLVLVLVGSSNAVNLTDGLDGLAIGCSNSAVAAYLLMAYVAGHYAFAEYLQVPFVKSAGELAVFCGALLGAGLGFLWFNCHPAKVFMGDTGSLAIGGAVATVAILIKQELVLILVGGVFLIEAASVMIQVGWFKFTRKKYGEGRRVFLRAPLHHHFEYLAKKQGKSIDAYENRIAIRFWILSIVFALIGLATLKIR